MPQHTARLLWARSLSVFGILVLLPLSLSACAWFLGKIAASHFVSIYASLDAHFMELYSSQGWVLYNLAGPVIAIIFLALAFVMEQDQGRSVLSRRWTRFILITAGILLCPLLLGMFIHAILRT